LNKATVGGIFSIVSGGIGILMSLFYLAYPLFMTVMFATLEEDLSSADAEIGSILAVFWLVFGLIFFFYLIVGALAVVGGICAIKKRAWGLSLAGAIAGSVAFYYTGIVAVVLVSMAQQEFPKKPVPASAVAPAPLPV
jgi:hypothetical protein